MSRGIVCDMFARVAERLVLQGTHDGIAHFNGRPHTVIRSGKKQDGTLDLIDRDQCFFNGFLLFQRIAVNTENIFFISQIAEIKRNKWD